MIDGLSVVSEIGEAALFIKFRKILEFASFAAMVAGCAVANAQTAKKFVARDGVEIAASFYQAKTSLKGSRVLTIVAPGFAATKDSAAFSKLCPALAASSDVICFDFRGTGQSGGEYTFGERDELDLEPILGWARGTYAKINVIGFSMGAYSAMRAVSLWPQTVAHLLLISVPTSIGDIVMSGGVFTNVFHIATNWGSAENQTGANPFFRWGNPFPAEPDLAEVASATGAGVAVPTSFLVGSEDALVYTSLSQQVYEATRAPKTWVVFPGGEHAEAMYVQNPAWFLNWVQSQLAR